MSVGLLFCHLYCALSALMLGMPTQRLRLGLAQAGWRVWRLIGVAALMLSLLDGCRRLGLGNGWVTWFGLLTLATLCLALLLTYRPRGIVRLLPFAVASVLLLWCAP
ncbi:DUF3325 family protein [Azovibrio restrictus]|uniref:DUF3325 family protein n=1 Tax=Azovibrio restrictus TaxID=146938 RepID=UPI0026E99135|nr:DUF3325 family protein [Azovibrio restrictus]MDD3483183.1 DUF3325 family protein [Azovibrio restrictus]